MTVYDCRDCGQQLHTPIVRSKGTRTFAANRGVDIPVPCQNAACPRYQLALVFGQAVPRVE